MISSSESNWVEVVLALLKCGVRKRLLFRVSDVPMFFITWNIGSRITSRSDAKVHSDDMVENVPGGLKHGKFEIVELVHDVHGNQSRGSG
jgi:hypothetical protein